MTPMHLAVAMEYAPGGDLSEYVDACKRAGVRSFIYNLYLSETLFMCQTASWQITASEQRIRQSVRRTVRQTFSLSVFTAFILTDCPSVSLSVSLPFTLVSQSACQSVSLPGLLGWGHPVHSSDYEVGHDSMDETRRLATGHSIRL